MKRSQQLAYIFFTFLFAAATAQASFVPDAPGVNARGFILTDHDSGQTLTESNADERLEPASLTKLMTAYVVFSELSAGHIALGDQVLVSEKAWRMPGSRMFIEVGTRVSVEELLKGMIIQSGNDASVALAEHVAGSEDAFADLMNEYARRLGLQGSHFVNATGLPDPEHYTTARDMARLASALIRDFPEHYAWHAQKSYTYNDITQHNRNRLLWRDESVDGLKTGHTEAAGYCLVASAKRDEMRLIAVVMGTDSEEARARESQKLLSWGFRFFETHRLYAAGQPIKEMRIWQGEVEQLPLGLQQDLYVTVPRGQYDKLNATMTLTRQLTAPATRGETFGTVRVTLGEQALAEQPLLALRDVAEGSLWQQARDAVLMMFE